MSHALSPSSNEQPKSRMAMPNGKTLVFFFGVLVITVFAVLFKDAWSLEALAARQSQLTAFQQDHPIAIYGLAFAVYAGVTGLSLPGAAPLTLVFAWFFGFWPAMILISFASTTGATIAFLSSRYLLRDTVRSRYGEKVGFIEKKIEQEGAYYLFTLRLIPAVPFFVINLAMGLTPIRTKTYWWVSQLGMLPGTAAYVFAGSRVPDLQTLADEGVGAVFSGTQLLQLLIAFAVLGLLPITLKYFLGSKGESTTESHSEA
ncbi:MAG: TVP38/TMEM64 family protein [Planctomycetota bacterium]